MEITTKYNISDKVFFVVGSGDNAKIVESPVQSIDISVTASSVSFTYNCQISRKVIGTEVAGSPDTYTVPRVEKNMYDTLQQCVDAMLAEAEAKNKSKKN